MQELDFSCAHFLFPPINREGIRFVIIGACVSLVLSLLLRRAGLYGFAMLIWLLPLAVYYFFRDPERYPPLDEKAILSPADGTVCLIDKRPIPAELNPSSSEPVWRVCVFMSVLDVHVNRAPAAGKIRSTHYVKGAFFNASLDKASDKNERYLYLMESRETQFAFVQIAGLVARRIVPFVRDGQPLAAGERFGLIRFGSRLDVYLPPGLEPEVRPGQTLIAGESAISHFAN